MPSVSIVILACDKMALIKLSNRVLPRRQYIFIFGSKVEIALARLGEEVINRDST